MNPIVDGQVLVVSKDLVNPEPDRRQRHDWRKEVTIPKGFRMVVVKHEGTGKYEPSYISLRPVDTRWSHQDLVLNARGEPPTMGSLKALTALVMENIEVVEHDFKTMARYHWVEPARMAYEIVEELMLTGKLTLAEAEALFLANQKRGDA